MSASCVTNQNRGLEKWRYKYKYKRYKILCICFYLYHRSVELVDFCIESQIKIADSSQDLLIWKFISDYSYRTVDLSIFVFVYSHISVFSFVIDRKIATQTTTVQLLSSNTVFYRKRNHGSQHTGPVDNFVLTIYRQVPPEPLGFLCSYTHFSRFLCQVWNQELQHCLSSSYYCDMVVIYSLLTDCPAGQRKSTLWYHPLTSSEVWSF